MLIFISRSYFVFFFLKHHYFCNYINILALMKNANIDIIFVLNPNGDRVGETSSSSFDNSTVISKEDDVLPSFP